ncbi:MAG: sel1 repeat family protein, partial [Oscillospiraceae bacterium]|nr:sel1 repeat family protein [Oscillospiraceae bacterium]
GFDYYRKGEYEEAARLYRISADLGFFRAQYSLALLYSEGCGVEKNLAEAEKWAQKAADQGHESAAKLVKELQEKRSATSDALALGVNFYEQEDYEQAVHHFRTAANQGNTNAQSSLAVCYATGKGVEKDLDTAELWAKRALDSGDEKAAELLDAIHEEQRDEAFELGVSCHNNGDYVQAAQHFRTAAEQGLAVAQYNLSVCYANGEGVEKDLVEAEMWAQKAAAQGHENANNALNILQRRQKENAFEIGVQYFKQGDHVQAVRFFRMAAEDGEAAAQFNLALCYEQGEGVEKSQSEAIRWYRAAAEQGVVEAQLSLASYYFDGDGVAQDLSKAAHWFRAAAQQGHAGAQYNLSLCYRQGLGVEQNYAEAVHWCRMAAQQGAVKAQHNLAVCYATGEGVEKDMQEAIHWYRKAAEQGDADAQYHLAGYYATGKGVEKDLAEAEMWAQKAAEQGYENAAEMLEEIKTNQTKDVFILGVTCHEKGEYTQAVQHFRTAAEQGNRFAQYNLALCYEQGEGVEKNQSEAVRWYRAAAEQGDAKAQLNLARYYFKGEGVEQDLDAAILWAERACEQESEVAAKLLELLKAAKEHPFDLGVACFEKNDYKKAVLYFRIAAQQGDANAQFNLALCYSQGQGVEQDQSEAARWYRKAAEQGDAKAQFLLARHYENGNGVEQNYQEAFHWYHKAAEQGDVNAQFILTQFYVEGRGVEQSLEKALLWT